MANELEDLLAEKARRQQSRNVDISPAVSESTTAKPVAAESKPKIAGKENKSFLQKINPSLQKGVDFFENYMHLPELGASILQSMADAPISVANLGLGPLGMEIPHPDLRGMLNKPETIGGNAVSILGSILGGYGPATKAFGMLDKAMPMAAGGGVAGDVFKGLLTGFGLGETGEGGEGRTEAAAFGGLLAPAARLFPSAVAHRVSETKNRIGKQFNEIYDGIFKAKGTGAKPTKVPKANYDYLRKQMGKDYRQALDNFLGKPTIENGHKLQSDLGKFLESIDKSRIRAGGSLPSAKNEAEEIAAQLQKKIRGSIFTSLSDIEPGLGKTYQAVTKQYAEKMAPYLNPDILKYQAGKTKGSELYEALKKNHEFRFSTRGQHPQFDLNDFLGAPAEAGLDAAKQVGKYAAGYGLGQWGLDKYHGFGGGEE